MGEGGGGRGWWAIVCRRGPPAPSNPHTRQKPSSPWQTLERGHTHQAQHRRSRTLVGIGTQHDRHVCGLALRRQLRRDAHHVHAIDDGGPVQKAWHSHAHTPTCTTTLPRHTQAQGASKISVATSPRPRHAGTHNVSCRLNSIHNRLVPSLMPREYPCWGAWAKAGEKCEAGGRERDGGGTLMKRRDAKGREGGGQPLGGLGCGHVRRVVAPTSSAVAFSCRRQVTTAGSLLLQVVLLTQQPAFTATRTNCRGGGRVPEKGVREPSVCKARLPTRHPSHTSPWSAQANPRPP